MRRDRALPAQTHVTVRRTLDRASTWVIAVGMAVLLFLAALFVARELGLTGTNAREGPGSMSGSASGSLATSGGTGSVTSSHP